MIGQPAPDFELPNQDGRQVKLSDYRGKKVVIFAFPKANTAGCNNQACGFRDEFPRIETANAVILGISGDSQDKLREWKAQKNLPYDLLSDTGHEVLGKLNAWGISLLGLIKLPVTTRSFWVIDEDGRVIDMQVGISPMESVRRALAAVENVSQPG
ncbi:MAG: peroxiredoxin [Anaerolineaceae bacterium]|nr:peroxiredoxin [Anaerolineaceae bacterium]